MTTPARQYHQAMVHYLRYSITFADRALVKDMGTLPAGAIVVGGGVHVTTAFNGSGTDTLDVGFRAGSSTDDPNGYATLLDLSAVGFIALDELAATTNVQQTTSAIATCSYVDQNSNASAGAADVVIMYIADNDA
jgi:hypothetical protein